jgi:prephenate dehydrogenase
VAGSNTSIWADIYLANRDTLRLEIEDTIAQLRAVQALLAEGDRDAIADWNDAAAAAHDRLRDARGAEPVSRPHGSNLPAA